MKILLISQYFWPENFLINDLAVGLNDAGHDITVLTGYPNYPGGRLYSGYKIGRKRKEDYQGVKVVRVPMIPRGNGRALRLICNYFSFAFSASILAPILCRNKYDLILVYEPSPITVGLPAIVMKKMKGVPIAFWVQDLWPESLKATGAVRSARIIGIIGKMVRFIYKNCDYILVPSQAFRQSIESFKVNSDKIEYFPNSADSFYKPVKLENDAEEIMEMPEGFRIVFAGNIGAAQDFNTILSAAEKLVNKKDIKWIVFGDGRQRLWVESEIKKRKLEDVVFLLGKKPAKTMPRYFALADTLLVTLRKDPIFALTIPSKVQAYLACGRPILCALDGEGARVVEEAEAGLTCPSEQPELLARKVLELYRMNASERQAMGERGRSYFENNFERGALLDRMETIMTSVINNKRHQRKKRKMREEGQKDGMCDAQEVE